MLRRLAPPLSGVVLILLGLAISGWPLLVALDASIDQRTVGFIIITAVFTAVGAVGTGIAAVVAAFALTRSENNTKWATYRDTLWRFSDSWAKLAPERKMFAEGIAKGTFDIKTDSQTADELLDFLDGLGFMARHGHIDMEMCWSWFYEESLRIWNSLFDYVRKSRVDNPLLWADIKPCLDAMHKIENEKRSDAGLEPAKVAPKG